ncbi:hypothetical protein [Sporosarcina trichiuri]|uniref:hypothetical protein n=1 Tax=Sporosarcina trichiuri TaxID=3056445 RepID=UPI0025B2B20E|nr:hypothetical protein [Sporosarcina sp. 0.2-SM1T-5]WJY28146.1 hypothetical protein QWT68_03960 [Sporosarcina sp. 0.2-SM1T-5]
MVIGVGLIILGPFMVFLLPNFVANSLHFRAGSWFVFTQKGVYGLYAAAFALLIAACFVLYAMSLVRKSWYIGGGLVVLSAFFFYLGSLHYIMLTDNGFEYRPLLSFSANEYKWGDVEDAVFRSVPSKDGDSTLTFTFDDGTPLEMKVDRLVFKFMQPIENRLSYEGVEVEKILIPPKD